MARTGGERGEPAWGRCSRAGPRSQAVLAAIRELNGEVEVIDRGAYLRVLVRDRCRLTRSAVERHLGERFHLPGRPGGGDGLVRGTLSMSEEEAVWT